MRVLRVRSALSEIAGKRGTDPVADEELPPRLLRGAFTFARKVKCAALGAQCTQRNRTPAGRSYAMGRLVCNGTARMQWDGSYAMGRLVCNGTARMQWDGSHA